MKKGIFLFAFLLQSWLIQAQGFISLKVTDMPGYPALPADTAYEGVLYSFNVILYNNTNSFIDSLVTINFRIDSVIAPVISTNPATSIPPNDSIVIPVSQYGFNQPFYKTGNNIVVVWPVVNGMFVPIDTTYKDVYFVPLTSVGEPEVKSSDIQVYPIPAKDFLDLHIPDGEHVECVRIFDTSGRVIRDEMAFQKRQLDVSLLKPGIYFIEIRTQSSVESMRFVKL